MPDNSSPPIARQGKTTEHTLSLGDRQIPYTATAEWQTLYENEKPIAEMFHVAYLAKTDSPSRRSLTFVFNGGPGAASAYLHMGALGPRRIAVGANGSLPKPPVRMVDNLESWLSFTDLVFIDPIGTGFSRSLPPDKENEKSGEKKLEGKNDKPKEAAFWDVERDLKSLGEFIQGFLSRQKRWLSPSDVTIKGLHSPSISRERLGEGKEFLLGIRAFRHL